MRSQERVGREDARAHTEEKATCKGNRERIEDVGLEDGSDVATSQGIRAALRRRVRQRRVSPRASAGNLALPTPGLEPSDNDGGLLPSRTVRE